MTTCPELDVRVAARGGARSGARPRRRQRVAAGAAAVLLVTMAVLGQRFWSQRTLTLPAPGVGLGPSGQTVELAGVRGASSPTETGWLNAGRLPTASGVDPDLVRDALLDLRTLGHQHGVTVAGWTPAWRYVWPRDSAFVASAFARTGHLADAAAQLSFLQRVQPTDGRFQARYLPDGSGPPDARGVELDGSGWALWGLAEVAAEVPATKQAAFVSRYRALLDRSTAASITGLDPRTHLPVPSPDYWEVPESAPTLATGATLLAGLRSAEQLYALIGADDAVRSTRIGADLLQDALVDHFERDGYPRHPGGRASSVDLGVTFLLPPFAGVERPAAVRAWQGSAHYLARPAGGLAPGGSWRNDGISWTPTVSTYAMAASCRDPAAATRWLDWLDQHRTEAGALPEKVLSDGSPASVAPLAWTAAAVVITADQLQHGCRVP
ncbi:MAG: glucoamylase [Propionibacteriaceae bacterium]